MAKLQDDSRQESLKSLCFNGIWARLIPIIFYVAIVLLFLYLLRKYIQGPSYRKRNRIDGKVVVITGCNGGIGKQTVLELAQRGARIYMACRDMESCEKARLEVVEQTGNQNIFRRHLDLASLASIRQFAEQFLSEETRLDILINNAGVMASPRRLTADGFEQQFGVNHLGHFLLTNLLLERLVQSAPSRIVVLSSVAHLTGRINKNDLMGEKHYSPFFGAYCQSKLANILFTKQLAKKLEGTKVTANCCHPGVVRTLLWRHCFPKWSYFIVNFVTLFFYKSIKAGVQTTLRLAVDPDLENASGGYYLDMMKFPLLPKARDEKMAEWLWNESEKLVGLQPTDSVQQVVVNHL